MKSDHAQTAFDSGSMDPLSIVTYPMFVNLEFSLFKMGIFFAKIVDKNSCGWVCELN